MTEQTDIKKHIKIFKSTMSVDCISTMIQVFNKYLNYLTIFIFNKKRKINESNIVYIFINIISIYLNH